MAYKRLTIDDLRTILSEDEVQRLNTLSKDANITQIVNDGIDLVASTWRGALKAKGLNIDTRDYYVPSEYWYYILVHARHAVWTRFTKSTDIALDERRMDEYKKAMELLENPWLNVSKPDWEFDPTNPENQSAEPATSKIFLPPLRFPPWYGGLKEIGGYSLKVWGCQD